ncbi:hypothetical protein PG993_000550 [Apiospora rasikravindrae]|uniref:Transmembrane protein n=1 Tax=Apiospora rasikravindrae TaxID=990691 RepID=A0ABR1UBM9_9PEZI
MAFITVGDFIPQLANLSVFPPSSRALKLGGQNFTHCCLRAVNESLAVSDSNLTLTDGSFFQPGTTAASLQAAVDNDQFPCGAEWNGDAAGAPVVQVPYSWCTAQCPGWEISHFSKLSQWIGPLVQFILPSLAFCLNVPRARKLAVPEVVFRARPHDVLGFATYWLRLLGAMLLMALDTTVWLSICFAFAGPMLMSAMCEFVLDRKVLEFLRPPGGSSSGRSGGEASGAMPLIPAKVRAQLLLAVVVGNVRISTTGLVERRRSSYATATTTSVPNEGEATYGNNIMVMIDEYEELQESGGLQVGIVSLPTKLKALLNSQASFGSTIGAPVLFFVGGFIYTVIDIQNSLGDNDSAHALAFGMWWMTIPYLATVSCAMLASNSSSVLQGIVYGGGSRAGPTKPAPGFWSDIKARLKRHAVVRRMVDGLNGYELIEHTYEGRFQTVTLWNRGLNKRRWVHEAIKDYAKEHAATTNNSNPGEEGAVSTEVPPPPPPSKTFITPDELRAGLRLRFGDLWNVFWGTGFLLLVPSLLAFLTSYNTPRKVLSCRTITYLLYAASQACAVVLWAWEARLKVRYGARWSETPSREKALNWWSQALVGFVGVFAAVGGTLMQLLGPYRACGCRPWRVPILYSRITCAIVSIPAVNQSVSNQSVDCEQIAASQWLRPSDPDAIVVLSTNTKDSILAAQEWWTVTGTVAVIFLGVVCALAWWHQRRLRKLFLEEAESLETDWILTTTLVASRSVGTTAAVVQQRNHPPTDLTPPKKELG